MERTRRVRRVRRRFGSQRTPFQKQEQLTKQMMRLALSGRIAEPEHVKEASVGVDELAQLAAKIGYQALCLRPSQVNLNTSDDRLREMRGILDHHGLHVSMITPDTRIARQGVDAAANATLRNIEPALHAAHRLGADLVRVALKGDADIPWAQRAADAARNLDLRIVHQTHTATPFETLASCLALLHRIDRPNFGLTVEPSNLALCGEDYGASALRPLGPFIFNVYVQNVRVTPNGRDSITTNGGTVRYDRLIVGDAGGINQDRFFAALRALDYHGYVTVHQPFVEGITMHALAKRVYDALSPFVR